MRVSAKLSALVVNSELGLVAARSVAAPQKGFLADRNIDDDVLGLDGAMVTANLRPNGEAAAMLFGFEAAFPSLGHGWIFVLLRRMRLPLRLLGTIEMMYHNMVTYFEVGGHVCAVVELKSGIRQGCPLSGTICAIALDPAIRYFLEQATFASCRIFAFADDLAVVLTKIAEQLVQLARFFDEWYKASGLCLKPRKCMRIPLWDGGFLELRGVVDAVPAFTGMETSSSARYLGVLCRKPVGGR